MTDILTQTPHDAFELAIGQDALLEWRIVSRETARLTADAASGALSLTVAPLDYAIADASVLRFGKNTLVTLSAAAAAGATSLTVSAIPGPLYRGDEGQRVSDLTSWTVEFEMLDKAGDATPVIATTDVTVTIPSQAGATYGIVRVTIADTILDPISAGSYYAALWRRNAGEERPLAEATIKVAAKGFQ